MQSRRRHRGRETAEKRERIEVNRHRAVREGLLERDADEALGTSPNALLRERKRRPKDLSALLTSEPLVLPASESSIRAGFDALVNRLGVRPRVAAEVDDMAMLRLLARERLGLAVVPSIVVQDELRTGMLVEVAPLPLVETFFAITLARRFPNPLLKVLLRERGTGKRVP